MDLANLNEYSKWIEDRKQEILSCDDLGFLVHASLQVISSVFDELEKIRALSPKAGGCAKRCAKLCCGKAVPRVSILDVYWAATYLSEQLTADPERVIPTKTRLESSLSFKYGSINKLLLGAGQSCPFLISEVRIPGEKMSYKCQIYPSRPMTCRTFGVTRPPWGMDGKILSKCTMSNKGGAVVVEEALSRPIAEFYFVARNRFLQHPQVMETILRSSPKDLTDMALLNAWVYRLLFGLSPDMAMSISKSKTLQEAFGLAARSGNPDTRLYYTKAKVVSDDIC